VRARIVLAAAMVVVAIGVHGVRAEDLADKIERMERELEEMKRELQRRRRRRRRRRRSSAPRKRPGRKRRRQKRNRSTVSWPIGFQVGGYGSMRFEASDLAEQKKQLRLSPPSC